MAHHQDIDDIDNNRNNTAQDIDHQNNHHHSSSSDEDGEEVSNLWVFGYGSLIWKPGFEFNHHSIGYVRGYSRRFYQGNDVQRGSPDKVRKKRERDNK